MIFRASPTAVHASSARAGITLLEILISLAVAVIGIFGVLVLIPVSARLAETGLDLDDAGAVGRQAIQEFEVRGMRDPASWLAIDPTAPGAGPTGVPIRANESYCIDPEFYARNLNLVSPAAFAQYGAWFPVNSGGNFSPVPQAGLVKTPAPSMRRISLRSSPGAATLMSEAQAQLTFTGLDDLQFTDPEDKSNPPTQVFHGSELLDPFGGNPEVLTKRQSVGETSWIAMLTPRPSATGLPESDMYTLYVVVFQERDANLGSQINVGSGTLVPEPVEKWCEVSFNTTGAPTTLQGLGGGEAIIRPMVTNPALGLGTGTVTDINDLVRDEWLLICQRITAQRAGGFVEVYDQFRWYRVADVSEVNPGNPPTRFVSLDGPDWITPADTATPGGVQFGPIFGVKMNGVLEVYERTVRLERNSIWTQ